jgi:hypothetical protein
MDTTTLLIVASIIGLLQLLLVVFIVRMIIQKYRRKNLSESSYNNELGSKNNLYCENCKNIIPSDAIYCRSCGHKSIK